GGEAKLAPRSATCRSGSAAAGSGKTARRPSSTTRHRYRVNATAFFEEEGSAVAREVETPDAAAEAASASAARRTSCFIAAGRSAGRDPAEPSAVFRDRVDHRYIALARRFCR